MCVCACVCVDIQLLTYVYQLLTYVYYVCALLCRVEKSFLLELILDYQVWMQVLRKFVNHMHACSQEQKHLPGSCDWFCVYVCVTELLKGYNCTRLECLSGDGEFENLCFVSIAETVCVSCAFVVDVKDCRHFFNKTAFIHICTSNYWAKIILAYPW